MKPGIYKIQNPHGQTYADIHERLRVVCCLPDIARRAEGKGNRTPVLVTHGSCVNPTPWGKVWRAPYAGADNNNSAATSIVSVLAYQP